MPLIYYSNVAARTPGLTHEMNSKLTLYQGETASKNIFKETVSTFFSKLFLSLPLNECFRM